MNTKMHLTPLHLKKFALLACVITFLVMALGAYTRLIDAGLGCPDWPGCYGHLTVPMNQTVIKQSQIRYPATPLVAHKAWAEMIHRYAAACLSLLFVLLFLSVWRLSAISNRRALKRCFIILFAVIAYQILLGRLTVTWQLLPIIVSQHLLGGMSILSLFWLSYLLLDRPIPCPTFKNRQRYRLVSGCVLILLIGQLFLGAWTSTHYASLSCPDFPMCSRGHPLDHWHLSQAFNLFPKLGINYEGGVLSEPIRQTIQMCHRFGALIVSSVILLFIIHLNVAPYFQDKTRLLNLSYLILLLLTLQVTLGIINVLYALPLSSAVAHNLIAGALLLSIITLNVEFYVHPDGENHANET